jgi:glucose-1-phosphate adenylyltransferase
LYRIDLQDFISFHKEKKADITIASKPIDREEAKTIDTSKMEVGKNCFIRNAIIDKNVRIGDNVVIDYKGDKTIEKDCGSYHIIDGIVVVPKNGEIPANTKVK